MVVLLVDVSVARAQSTAAWPSRPVRVIVTNPPGGTIDALARVLAEHFAKRFGQPFVLDHRNGANGNVGAETMLRSPADGYTLMVGPAGPFTFNQLFFPAMAFDPKTAFAPISMIGAAPLILVVNPAFPARSLREFVEYARANPGKISYGSPGIGSTGQLATELFAGAADIDMVHVPYKGTGLATADLIAGHLQAMFDNTTSALPHIRRGSLRAIAIAERHRLNVAPEIPTFEELGFPGFEATPWFGLAARAGTLLEIIERLATEASAALREPAVAARFESLGVELRGTTPSEFAAAIRIETEKWTAIARRAGARVK